MNPATALATVLVDELSRCGLAEAVVAPGSRNAPLSMALWEQAARSAGRLRLHVRIDERSAAFLALGLAKLSRRPVAVVCTSGTAAAHFHAAVIEADEAGVPLLVLTADRPPELRGTGANQTVDQLKLYGSAVRWFCEVGVPEARPGMNAYWRSLACRAWASAAGAAGTMPGPVHLNLCLREPLVPDEADTGPADLAAVGAGAAGPATRGGWPEPLAGRAGETPWTVTGAPPPPPTLELPWTERGVVVCGDGSAGPAALLRLAAEAGWPVLAEPSSGARAGPSALAAYPYLLESPEFVARHRPEVIVSAGLAGAVARPARLPEDGRAGRRAAAAHRDRAGTGTLGGSGADRHRRRRGSASGEGAGHAGHRRVAGVVADRGRGGPRCRSRHPRRR